MMIKPLYTSVTLLAMFSMLKNVCLAYIAEILILVYIKSDYIITFQLCFSFQVDRFICGVLNCCFIGVLYQKYHQNHIDRPQASCECLSPHRIEIHDIWYYNNVKHQDIIAEK